MTFSKLSSLLTRPRRKTKIKSFKFHTGNGGTFGFRRFKRTKRGKIADALRTELAGARRHRDVARRRILGRGGTLGNARGARPLLHGTRAEGCFRQYACGASLCEMLENDMGTAATALRAHDRPDFACRHEGVAARDGELPRSIRFFVDYERHRPDLHHRRHGAEAHGNRRKIEGGRCFRLAERVVVAAVCTAHRCDFKRECSRLRRFL